jgi:hypothetical protein
MTKEKLAKKFSQLLIDEVGRFKVCRINRLNRNEKNKDICHSHDFTDANEIMLAAREELGIEFPNHDDEWDVLSEAWGLAKTNNFYI